MTDADLPDLINAPETVADGIPVGTSRPLYLVDGSGYIFRAFHALPPLSRSDGTPINAVLGFSNMLAKLLTDFDAAQVAVIFDAGARSFRNDLYGDYKAHRPDPPDELIPQFPLIREATAAFDVPQVELEGYEADDLIATYARLAREAGQPVVIVSSDKDLMQLVCDGVTMWDPIKAKPIGRDEVIEKFGVPPEQVIDVQALCGDSVDNVPGVPGIGVKTASQLILEYGDLDQLLARAGEIKQPKRRESLIQYAEQARLSRDLVRLDQNAPVPVGLEGLQVRDPDPARLTDFLRHNGFRTLLGRLESRLQPGGHVADALAEAPTAAGAPPIDHTRYRLLEDGASLVAFLARVPERRMLALDVQATPGIARAAAPIGIALAVAPGEAVYLPLGHERPEGDGLALDGAEAPAQIPLADAVALLKPVLEDRSILKIAHNAKADVQLLAELGIALDSVDDVMLASYVLDGGAHGHGLDELARLHLAHEAMAASAVCGSGRAALPFARVAPVAACPYAAEQADLCVRLHPILKGRLVTERMVTLYERVERPLVGVVAGMESAGILVDRTELNRLSTWFGQRMAGLEATIFAAAGGPLNLGSPKQLGELLFGKLGLTGARKVKSGGYSTDSDVLEGLAAEGHQIAAQILEWRQVQKLKSTYADALQAQVSARTGRVHTSYALAATNTGRLSSTEPNVQNIPVRTEDGRMIRAAFVAAPGHVLLSADYSQIELRLAAEIAGIAALQQAFRDGVDIHALTASQVFEVPLEQMTGEIRRRAKAINFGIIYGISAFGLANQLGVPQADARTYIQAYFDRFSELRAYMEETKLFARQHGYVVTLYGRKCHVPDIGSKNPAARSFAERQAINARLQGTAADIVKRAMIRIPPALAEAGLQAKLLLQVHDELVFEVPEAEADRTAQLVKRTMEGAARLSIPLVAEAGYGSSWEKAH